jgi:hypothetical protein
MTVLKGAAVLCILKNSVIKNILKGQCHEIFDPLFFFHQSTPYMALINGLNPFRIWLRIRRQSYHHFPGHFKFDLVL